MRNVEYGMRSSTSSTASGPPSPQGEGLKTEVEEIASVQVLFPDRRTLDEVIRGLIDRIEMLEKRGSDEVDKI